MARAEIVCIDGFIGISDASLSIRCTLVKKLKGQDAHVLSHAEGK